MRLVFRVRRGADRHAGTSETGHMGGGRYIDPTGAKYIRSFSFSARRDLSLAWKSSWVVVTTPWGVVRVGRSVFDAFIRFFFHLLGGGLDNLRPSSLRGTVCP